MIHCFRGIVPNGNLYSGILTNPPSTFEKFSTFTGLFSNLKLPLQKV